MIGLHSCCDVVYNSAYAYCVMFTLGGFLGIVLSVIRVEWVSAFCIKRQVIHREYIEPMNWTYITVVQPSPGSRASSVRTAASSRNSPDGRPAFLATISNNGLGLNSQPGTTIF